MSIIVKILWNLLCQYNNIYTSLHKYFKEKKTQTDYRIKKKKKKQKTKTKTKTKQNKTLDTVATVLVE